MVSISTIGHNFELGVMTLFSEAGQTIIILLMLIGGSPGSTAGGMKTTTLAVLFMTLFAVFQRKEDTECFGRRIEENTVKYAAAILLMYLAFFLTDSAIGTVGLTLGITPGLGTISRVQIFDCNEWRSCYSGSVFPQS